MNRALVQYLKEPRINVKNIKDPEGNNIPFICQLPAGSKVYRTNTTGDWYSAGPKTKSGRRRLKIEIDDAKKSKSKDGATRLPQFFSSWVVAATYSSPYYNIFYTFTTAGNIPLLKVSKEFIDFLIDEYPKLVAAETPSSAEVMQRDRYFIRNFVILFGYHLNVLYAHMSSEERIAVFGIDGDITDPSLLTKFKESIYDNFLSKYEYIILNDEYLEYTDSIFNRISTTDLDYDIFTNLFNIQWEPISSIVHGLSGIYIPPILSGMFNYKYALNVDDYFPEEVFLRNIEFKISEKPFLGTAPYFIEDVEEKQLQPIIIDINMYTSNRVDFFTTLSDSILNYIFLFNIIYSEIHTLIESCIKKMEESVEKYTLTSLYKKGVDSIIKKIKKSIKLILVECGKCIDSLLELDSGLIDPVRVPTQDNNPYYVMADFNANLYTYTILNADIKQHVASLNYLYSFLIKREGNTNENMNINKVIDDYNKFDAVISGGALFGIYTYGTYRKQTKDVDLKIILRGDNEKYGNENIVNFEYDENVNMEGKTHTFHFTLGDFSTMESLHWSALLVNFLWSQLTEFMFNKLATQKIFTYATIINSIGKMTILPKDYKKGANPLKWQFYTASNPNTRLLSDTISEMDLFYKSHGAPLGFIPDQFNKFIEERYALFVKSLTEEINSKLPIKYHIDPTSHIDINSLHPAIKDKLIKIITSINPCRLIIDNTIYFIKNYKGYRDDLRMFLEEKKSKKDKSDRTYYNKIINMLTDNFNILFKEYFKTSLPDYLYTQFWTRNNNLITLMSIRPKLEISDDSVYSLGQFLSLYVHKQGEGNNPDKTYGLIDYTFNTHYSTIGSFTKYANVAEYYTWKIGNIFYGSSKWFIHESIKLNEICNKIVYLHDELDESVNPHNGCAPKKGVRELKKVKYKKRYDMVLGFFKEYIKADLPSLKSRVGSVPEFITLEDVEAYLSKVYPTKKDYMLFDNELLHNVRETRIRTGEYMVGAGRIAKTAKKRLQARKTRRRN